MTGDLQLPGLDERRSVRSVVIDALRAALVTGQMTPGEVYSAPALAARFGVSATPVREALLELVKEGFVETVPNKGFRVRHVSDEELDEITQIRLYLEVPTTVAVIGRATKADLAALRRGAQDIVESAKAGDLIAYIENDRRFHLDLLAFAGNAQLVTLVGELRGRARLFGLAELVEQGLLTKSAAEHLEMLELIEAGSSEALAELMRRHISHVRGAWAGRVEQVDRSTGVDPG